MATTIEQFDSLGGFSINNTIIVDELKNAKDINTLEIKNSNFADSNTSQYILRGLNTSTMDLDGVGGQIPIGNSTINFITGNIIGVNAAGTVYAVKFETAVLADVAGNTTVLSSMQTVIKDDIPTGENWDVSPIGAVNRFSYNTVRAGTISTIKWVSSTQVVSIDWV